MKIAILCYPTFGGSGVVATELGTALAARGHEVHFITYSQPVRLKLLSQRIYFHEVSVQKYPLFQYQPYDLALSSKLLEVVMEFDIELLHVHYAIPHAYAGYMAKLMLKEKGYNLPMVTTLHGTDITLVGKHPFYKPAVNFSINNSDGVTSVSESLRQDTLNFFDISTDIDVVHNFIDMSKYSENFSDCTRTDMALPQERIVTHISNMRAVKRIEDVILTFAKINEEVPSILLMVGDGPDRVKGEALSRKLNLQYQVKFLGNSNEVDKILCFSDLFLLPSESESFGLAALEAMANKTPVISSNRGGLPEVNIHGKTGYLADVGDIDIMAAKGVEILKDNDTLLSFKKNAFEQAKTFAIEAIVPQYEAVYKRAVEKVNQ